MRAGGRIVSLALSLSAAASAGTFTQITNFGVNPSNNRMYLYVPTNVAAKPPILVAMHYCTGTANAFYTGTQFAAQADQYGFIVIYPDANRSGQCWDVHSTQSLTHNGGSDASGIISMIRWAVQNRNGDSARVYATGVSSGAMMTNVMLGSYPDVFKAGAAFAGVPFACFAGTGEWNSACANGTIIRTAVQWGDLVRAAYPGYVGPRPRMQLWHGNNDATLNFNNFGEEIKQWTNVLGVSQTPTSTESNQPQATWTRTRYRDNGGVIQVEAIREEGQPHNLQILADQAIAFFGLNVATGIIGSRRDRPPASVEVTRNAASVNFTVFAPRGRAELELRRPDGSVVHGLIGQSHGTKTLQYSWKGETGVYMALLKVNGTVVESFRFAMLTN